LLTFGISNPTDDDIFDYGLHLINTILSESGYNLAQWPSVPQPVIDWSNRIINPLIAEQMNYDHVQENILAQDNISQLDEDQQSAFQNNTFVYNLV
jgi:hypothetical protein